MKRLRASIALSISGIGIAITGFIMPTYIEIIRPYAYYILLLGICLIVCPWLLFIFEFIKNKKRDGHPITDPSDAIQINNPDFFPGLNETALKRHISLIINNPKYNSFNRLIQSVALYRGLNDHKYVLVFDFPDTISTEDRDDYQELLNHWSDPEHFRYSVADDFKSEVYRNETDVTADPYLDDWMVWTKKPEEDMPQDLILKDHKWVLYKK